MSADDTKRILTREDIPILKEAIESLDEPTNIAFQTNKSVIRVALQEVIDRLNREISVDYLSLLDEDLVVYVHERFIGRHRARYPEIRVSESVAEILCSIFSTGGYGSDRAHKTIVALLLMNREKNGEDTFLNYRVIEDISGYQWASLNAEIKYGLNSRLDETEWRLDFNGPGVRIYKIDKSASEF